MSSISRLQRLGLAHLADRPEALAKALAEQLQEGLREEKVIEAEMKALRASLGVDVLEDRADPPRRHATGLRSKKGR